MKLKPQIHIMDVLLDISVKSPYSPDNNVVFKALGGKYDKKDNRWLLPKDDDSRSELEALFGAESCNVIALVTSKDLTTVGKQLKIGGHVVANWDERQNRVSVPKTGVELMAGGWDDAASATSQTPCLSGPDAKLHVVVKRDFAKRHGLTVVEELPAETLENPLADVPDSDLITELRNRGYIVERDPRCFF
jgi:hypothetical protein